MTEASTLPETRALLQAGALLPPDAPIEADEPADTVGARSYSHPALGERRVVRLTPDSIASAEDLALEFLGFELDQVERPVARTRLQALGFPAWVLIHDPGNAAYALAVVKEMERLNRMARSRPGSARDGFDAIAQRLSRTTPQFLPTFYEQAGRAFLAAGNLPYAATMFAHGREAERIYNLEVDEQRRQEAFLEFALAGALTAKSLQEYAEQLSQTHDPAGAYAIFRDLCLQRTLGGVPPWTGMPEQLKRMARAAGLNAAAEEEGLLEQLLEAPATGSAPAGFWKAYRAALLRMARRSPRVRGLLLNLFPRPQRGAEGFDDWWLQLLDECGALEAVCRARGSVPPEADVRGSPAAWLSKMATRSLRGWWRDERVSGLHTLLPRMADRLRADGEPVDLLGGRGPGADLDLIDLALSLHIPLLDPAPDIRLHLRSWSRQPVASRSQLQHLNADPGYGPLLHLALEEYLQRHHADDLLGASGLDEAIKAWLGRWADLLEMASLVQIDDGLTILARATSPRSLGLNPDARKRILCTEIAAALARTLRGGLLDELGWPALEEAATKLHPGRQGLQLSPSWPNLVLSDGASRAIVVGPKSRLLEHDLRIPTQRIYGLPTFLYTGGQLLVAWSGPDGTKAYWSGRPAEIFEVQAQPGREHIGTFGFSWEFPDGGRTIGARAVHPGDTQLPASHQMVSDGVGFWYLFNGMWREYDPVTGAPGRTSLPQFLDGFGRDGHPLIIDRSWLMPLPPQIDGTPLGTRDGLVGWRIRRVAASRVYEGESIDGRTFSGSLGGSVRTWHHHQLEPVPVGLVALPGDEGRGRPLSTLVGMISLWDADSRRELGRYAVGTARPEHARGTPVVPPAMFWHNMQPRDPAGSLALRRLSDEHAGHLLASGREEIQKEDMPATRVLLRRLLPDVTHPELVTGVIGAVRLAASLVARLQRLDASDVDEVTTVHRALDDDLSTALRGLDVARIGGRTGTASTRTCDQVQVVATYMAASLNTSRFSMRRKDPMPKSLPSATLHWEHFIGRAGALAFRAAAPGTTDREREALLTFLELWAETPFAEHPEWFRIAQVALDQKARYQHQPAALQRKDGHHYYLSSGYHDYRKNQLVRTVVEGSSSGKFELPAELHLMSQRSGASEWDNPDRIRRFVQLVRERGPMSCQPEAVDDLSRRTGLSRAEAALLLSGLTNLDNYTHNFLPKELRESLGLKVAEAAAARDSLTTLTPQEGINLLAAAMPLDPAQLWEPHVPDSPGNLAERMASAWIAAFGKRISIPDQLLGRTNSVLPYMSTPLQTILAAFTQPATDPQLNRDAIWAIDANGRLVQQGTDPAFDANMLTAVAFLIPWLFSSLPVGDPLREMIPQVLERARARLENKDLLVGGDWMAAEIQGRSVLDLVPGEPYRPPFGTSLQHSRDAGYLVVALPREGLAYVFLRPAAINGDERHPLLDLLNAGRVPYMATSFLKGPGASDIAARVAQTPVPDGGWEANPLLSAPQLVHEVASTLSLEEDAAVLYLQILALPEPTTKNLYTWNGWNAKRLALATDALVARDLLVRAKRSRAGRDVFLPGPWEDLKAPSLPVEAWKRSLYGYAALGRMYPLKPLHQLFEEAWRRVCSGDAPAFESVPQGRRR